MKRTVLVATPVFFFFFTLCSQLFNVSIQLAFIF